EGRVDRFLRKYKMGDKSSKKADQK
ncbi:MAG: 50S ribosomal protein L31, partial [Microcystis aeruginosa Ma_AC_P_19900807_S299]